MKVITLIKRIKSPETRTNTLKESKNWLQRIHTQTYQGVKNVCFSENLACFVFLKYSFWDSPFCLITDEVLETIVRLNLKTKCIETLLCYIFLFIFTLALCVLFSYRKMWLSYLSHAISPYLHGKLINWTSPFYFRFCCTFLPRILNILLFQLFVFVNYIFLCNFTPHGICIEQIYCLINLYYFLTCVGHPKSVLTWYLGTLFDFGNY